MKGKEKELRIGEITYVCACVCICIYTYAAICVTEKQTRRKLIESEAGGSVSSAVTRHSWRQAMRGKLRNLFNRD